MKITAKCNTWLKKRLDKQASELSVVEKVEVFEGQSYTCDVIDEIALNVNNSDHLQVSLHYGAGKWFIYHEHWELPWTVPIVNVKKTAPAYKAINWNDYSSPVSRYFFVSEVTLNQKERIPQTEEIRQNVYRLAQELDKVREWWGSGLLVNSWYRPPAVEKRVGGSGENHPLGLAADIRPAVGSIYDFQDRFEKEWYNTGKWKGGMGRGAKKSFVHLDLNPRRIWNY